MEHAGKRKLEEDDLVEGGKQARKVDFKMSREKLKKEFTPAKINQMFEKRQKMDQHELFWALFSFNNVENRLGAKGGVYEIRENDKIIFISSIPCELHIRDALNAHFSGRDNLRIGKYLSSLPSNRWRDFHIRFMLSDTPREDARLLLRHHQLENKGAVPICN